MAKQSAGLLVYRICNGDIEVFLVHPGGPFWSNKDQGAWSIPKGEFGPEEQPLTAAKREFKEETGFEASGHFIPLKPVKQSSQKVIQAWAFEGDYDVTQINSNTFTVEWPPRYGKKQKFPEIDRAEWFPLETAKEKIIKGQVELLEELKHILSKKIAENT